MTKTLVTWPRSIEKQLDKIPAYLRDKFFAWVAAVERMGISEIRKLSGYHDEPLTGDRNGQRSIRLNQAYRAIYIEYKDKNEININVIKVSKHEY